MKIDHFLTTHSHPLYASKEINKGIENRKLKPKDVVSISFNSELGCYVVFFWSKDETR